MLHDTPAFSGYSVSDQQAAKAFYTDKLGLDVQDTPMGLQLTFFNGHNVFIYQKDDHTPANFTVLNFPVDNIEQTVDQLVANGVIFERYDMLPARQDEKGILRGRASNMGPDIAWFKDPSGNILSVLQS